MVYADVDAATTPITNAMYIKSQSKKLHHYVLVEAVGIEPTSESNAT